MKFQWWEKINHWAKLNITTVIMLIDPRVNYACYSYIINFMHVCIAELRAQHNNNCLPQLVYVNCTSWINT